MQEYCVKGPGSKAEQRADLYHCLHHRDKGAVTEYIQGHSTDCGHIGGGNGFWRVRPKVEPIKLACTNLLNLS